MALILSLETSTNVCSAAIHDQGKVLALAEAHIEQSHASKLAVLIDDIKKIAGVELSDLSGVAVSSGPGSYTGLRIGTSTAKGICYALSIPLLSVNTLDLLAFQVSHVNIINAFLCPMIDARRMEVYCQVVNAKLQIVTPVEAKIIDETSFIELLNTESFIFFGNGADKCEEVIKHPNAHFLKNITPTASALGNIASNKFEQGLIEDLVHFEPFYLKEFMAKLPATKF